MNCDTGLRVFDLSALSPDDGAELRELIIAEYATSRRSLKYDPNAIQALTVEHDGLPLRIGYVPNRPERGANEDVLCDFFLQRCEGRPDTTYRLGFKGRPYGNLHIVFGTREFGQHVELTPDRVDVGLLLSVLLGEEFDVFCNRVAPSTSDVFHFQAMIREAPIWDHLEDWPVRPELHRGSQRCELAESLSKRMTEMETRGRTYDLLTRFRHGEYEALLVPRARHQKRPPLEEFCDGAQFGDFGVLEMCGYFVTCKTERALETVKVLYKRALDSFNGVP